VRNTVKSATSGESDIERLYDHIRSAQVEVITPDPEESSQIELELSAIDTIVKLDGQKADDAPIFTGMWDGMFLRDWARRNSGRSIPSRWLLRRVISPAADPRDCDFSDTQLGAEIQLAEWRALFKIRAAALRYWRRKCTRAFIEHYWSTLPLDMRPYAGVDVTLMRDWNSGLEEGRPKPWEHWTRNFMGMKDSPYRSLQMMLVAKVLAYGDRSDPHNPLQWEKVLLNLPGSEHYDPRLPWVMKVRSDGKIACEIYIYVDDARVTGWCKFECWRSVRKFSCVLTRLGIQDATRKRTEPSRTPGPWAGTVTATNFVPEAKDAQSSGSESESAWEVISTVTQVKWDKTKALVEELASMMDKDHRSLDRNRLEQIRGFYVARTYPFLTRI